MSVGRARGFGSLTSGLQSAFIVSNCECLKFEFQQLGILMSLGLILVWMLVAPIVWRSRQSGGMV